MDIDSIFLYADHLGEEQVVFVLQLDLPRALTNEKIAEYLCGSALQSGQHQLQQWINRRVFFFSTCSFQFETPWTTLRTFFLFGLLSCEEMVPPKKKIDRVV